MHILLYFSSSSQFWASPPSSSFQFLLPPQEWDAAQLAEPGNLQFRMPICCGRAWEPATGELRGKAWAPTHVVQQKRGTHVVYGPGCPWLALWCSPNSTQLPVMQPMGHVVPPHFRSWTALHYIIIIH